MVPSGCHLAPIRGYGTLWHPRHQCGTHVAPIWHHMAPCWHPFGTFFSNSVIRFNDDSCQWLTFLGHPVLCDRVGTYVIVASVGEYLKYKYLQYYFKYMNSILYLYFEYCLPEVLVLVFKNNFAWVFSILIVANVKYILKIL